MWHFGWQQPKKKWCTNHFSDMMMTHCKQRDNMKRRTHIYTYCGSKSVTVGMTFVRNAIRLVITITRWSHRCDDDQGIVSSKIWKWIFSKATSTTQFFFALQFYDFALVFAVEVKRLTKEPINSVNETLIFKPTVVINHFHFGMRRIWVCVSCERECNRHVHASHPN